MVPVSVTITKWRTFKRLWWVQLLKRFVDLHEILYGGDAIEDDLDVIFSNPVPATIPKWSTFALLRWVQRNLLITFELIAGYG
jgi:hypothetical protein